MNFINRLPEIFGMRGQDVGEAGEKTLVCVLARGQQLLNSLNFLKERKSMNPFKNIFFSFLQCVVSKTQRGKKCTFRAKIRSCQPQQIGSST